MKTRLIIIFLLGLIISVFCKAQTGYRNGPEPYGSQSQALPEIGEERTMLETLWSEVAKLQVRVKGLEPLGLHGPQTDPDLASVSNCGPGWFPMKDTKCLYVLPGSMNRTGAVLTCASLYVAGQDLEVPRLLQLDSVEDESTVVDLIGNTTLGQGFGVWLGATRDRYSGAPPNSFSWEGGKPMRHNNWAKGHPSRLTVKECVVLKEVADHTEKAQWTWAFVEWTDALCSGINAVVCEKVLPMSYRDLVLNMKELLEERAAEKVVGKKNGTVASSKTKDLLRAGLVFFADSADKEFSYYYFAHNNMTWNDCITLCLDNEMEVLQPKKLVELVEIATKLKNAIGRDSIWSGVHFISGNDGEPARANNWVWYGSNNPVQPTLWKGDKVPPGTVQLAGEYARCGKLSLKTFRFFHAFCQKTDSCTCQVRK